MDYMAEATRLFFIVIVLVVADDADGAVSIPTAKKAADRNKGRFELKGGDAETAAKVLKRMLKQDSGFREGDSE